MNSEISPPTFVGVEMTAVVISNERGTSEEKSHI